MLFLPIKFKTTIQLYPEEMDAKFQERILEKLNEEYEGVCSKYGYIKPKSIEIIKRSCGSLQKAYFNGSIRFELLCRAEVCNPVQESVVEAIVKNKNQLGILAESYVEFNNEQIAILDIIIPIKSAGIISQVNLEQIQIGDLIHVEVMGKKYQMKDRKISIIGRVIIPGQIKGTEVIVEEEEVEPNQDDDDFVNLEAEKKGILGEDESEEEEEESEEEEDDDEFVEGEEYDDDIGDGDEEYGDDEDGDAIP